MMSHSKAAWLVLGLVVVAAGCASNDGGAAGDGGGRRDGGGTMNDGSTSGADGSATGGDDGVRDTSVAPIDTGTNGEDGGPVTGDGGPTSGDGAACGTREVCSNGTDDNCNGMVDEGCACLPGMSQRCYDGPAGTAGVGICAYGTQACVGSGELGMFGPCAGATHPRTEVCGNMIDDDCDGVVDDGCGCPVGMTRTCYSGPAGTAGRGTCRAGMQTCVAMGAGADWGPCVGQVLPSAEVCDGMDHDCDGMSNTGCTCTIGTSRSCYSGPMGTLGVGLCRAGSQMCVAAAGGRGSAWGPCVGEVLPAPNMCDGIDRLCNNMPAAGCTCTLGMSRACYTGPAATRGVGICRDGSQTCVNSSMGATWGTCSGGTLPAAAEVCGNMLDDNCNGAVDEGCGGMLACPGDRSVLAGAPVTLTAMGTGLTGFTWTIVSAPTGGAATATWMPAPPTAATETFTPYIVGVYTIRVTARDASGRTLSCMFNVTALPHGLRVQLTWNGAGDVDLHVNNAMSPWFRAPNDCYYANLTPAWGGVLDFDNVTADGPENIRVDTPAIGTTYTIGVHNYSRAAGRAATVQIFCGATMTTVPTQTFTSRALAGTASGNCTANDFWRVARVVFTSPSTCTITPINTYGPSSGACTAY